MGKHSLPIQEISSYPELPPIYEQTLGAAGVHAAQRAEWHDIQATYLEHNPNQGSEIVAARFAETFYGDAQQELEDTRNRLGGLDEHQKDKIDPYIETLLGEDVPANAYEYRRLSEWLEKGADDEQLLDFLGRHLNLISEQQQSPEVQEAIEQAKSDYADTVRDLVQKEYYDEHALTTLQNALDTKVYIGDVWDTTLRGLDGYHLNGTDYIVVGQGAEKNQEKWLAQVKGNIKSVVPHELSHVQFGANMPRVVYESIAEWGAMKARTGEIHSLAPYDNGNNDSNIYTQERSILSNALQQGGEPIALQAVTRAYSSGGPYSLASLEMRQAMFRAWGDHYFLDKLDKALGGSIYVEQ